MARALSDFHDDVQRAVGEKGLTDAIMTRMINDAYLDVAGGIDHEELMAVDTSQPTVVGTEAYNVPSDASFVDAVVDVTSDYAMEFYMLRAFYRRRSTAVGDRGEPKFYTRRGMFLLLSPVPDAIYTLNIIYRDIPTLLSADADESVLDELWEPAIFFLAVANTFMSYGDESRAAVWTQRAVAYLQTKGAKTESLVAALMKGLNTSRALES